MYIKEGNTYIEHYAFFGIKETRITLFCVIYSLSNRLNQFEIDLKHWDFGVVDFSGDINIRQIRCKVY